MSYCPGSNCSKKEQCQLHFESDYVVDWSTNGCGHCGIDENGNHFSHHEIFCGDNGTNGYQYFKELKEEVK